MRSLQEEQARDSEDVEFKLTSLRTELSEKVTNLETSNNTKQALTQVELVPVTWAWKP